MPADRGTIGFQPRRQVLFPHLLSPLVLTEVKHWAEYVVYRGASERVQHKAAVGEKTSGMTHNTAGALAYT